MISHHQYLEMVQRLDRNTKREPLPEAPAPYDGPESDIHDKILEYANAKGWAVVHSRMDRKSTIGIGCPDFILGAEDGKTFWIEAKRKGGKPTTEQLGRILMLKMLGHRAAIIFSFEEFLEFVK